MSKRVLILLIAGIGVAVLSLVIASVVSYKTPKSAPISHPGSNPTSPEIAITGDPTAFVANFQEPAPEGYAWEIEYDFDQTIKQKCLVNSTQKDGPIDDAVVTALRNAGHPQGYNWSYQQKSSSQGTHIFRMCLNGPCPNGKKTDGSNQCIEVTEMPVIGP